MRCLCNSFSANVTFNYRLWAPERPDRVRVYTNTITVATLAGRRSLSCQWRTVHITFHYIIPNVPSLCHFQLLFSKREQTCHALSQATSRERVSQESPEPRKSICDQRVTLEESEMIYFQQTQQVCDTCVIRKFWIPGAGVSEDLCARKQTWLGTHNAKSFKLFQLDSWPL